MKYYDRMTKKRAEEYFREIDNMSDTSFDDLLSRWRNHDVNDYNREYDDLREKILGAYKASKDIDDYSIDLSVGFCLYEALSGNNGFTNVLANNDDFWRYLSIKVFPDITYLRYPKPGNQDKRLNSKRFYAHTRRIWLKTLWWYIHLSWQGTEKSTRKVLENLGTDSISQLIERTGKGYRLSLYRELMHAYSGMQNKSALLFKQIQTRNRVNCVNVEPALTAGGERGYCRSLVQEFKKNEGRKP